MSSPTAADAGHSPATGGPAMLALAVSVLSIVVLIWSEIWLAIAALEWSLVALFGLGLPGYVLLSLVLVPAAAWASWQSALMAWTAERRLALPDDRQG